MNCESVQELLSAYMDDELDLVSRQLVSDHLETCSVCQEVLQDLRVQGRLVQASYAGLEVPLGLEVSILRSLPLFNRKSQQVRRLSALYGVITLLSALGVTAVVVSPVGMFFGFIFRASISISRGLVFMSTTLDWLWFSAIVVFCVLLAGLSLVGVSRLLRSSKGRVLYER